MLRGEKVEIVDGMRRLFSDTGVVVLTHYRGLSVPEATDLRRQMRAAGAGFRVTKNRLARIAVEGTPFEPLSELLTGPTAIAYSADPVVAPRLVVAYARRNDKVQIVGGGLAGRVLSAAEVRALAELPSLDELRARLIGLISAPASKLVRLLQTPGSRVARVLAARAEAAEAS